MSTDEDESCDLEKCPEDSKEKCQEDSKEKCQEDSDEKCQEDSKEKCKKDSKQGDLKESAKECDVVEVMDKQDDEVISVIKELDMKIEGEDLKQNDEEKKQNDEEKKQNYEEKKQNYEKKKEELEELTTFEIETKKEVADVSDDSCTTKSSIVENKEQVKKDEETGNTKDGNIVEINEEDIEIRKVCEHHDSQKDEGKPRAEKETIKISETDNKIKVDRPKSLSASGKLKTDENTDETETGNKTEIVKEIPKGHTNEIREKIEKNMNATALSPTKTDAGVDLTTPPPQEMRKKKADEWLTKVKRTTSNVSEYRSTKSPAAKGLDPVVKSDTKVVRESSWKKREEQVKKEKEEKEATQKLSEEKKKKVEEERKKLESERRATAAAREQARKQKEEEEKLRREQLRKERSELVVRKTTRNGVSSSSVHEDEIAKKKCILESRIQPLNIEGLDKDGLEKVAREMHEKIRILEEQKYDLEVALEKREAEHMETRSKTGDSRGKFVKPPLKKVEKTIIDPTSTRYDANKPSISTKSNSTLEEAISEDKALKVESTNGKPLDETHCQQVSPELTGTVPSVKEIPSET